MRLIYADASPFARKARILIIELGLENSVTLDALAAVTPVSSNEALNDVNPLGMVPALDLGNGDSLYDSLVICEYLDDIGKGHFFPTDSSHRIRALALHALANGMLDLAVALRYETALRPEELRWPSWIEHQKAKIERGLDALEKRCSEFEFEPLIGEITVACVLGYLDFRYADNNWRSKRPSLAGWFEKIMQRDSLVNTKPA